MTLGTNDLDWLKNEEIFLSRSLFGVRVNRSSFGNFFKLIKLLLK